jgi:isopropylmalate/homocitrate/citramalate synthase
MGPLALLALGLGGAGLASVMKKKGIDLKKKEKKKVVKEIIKKKKKKHKPEWQTETDPEQVKKQRENWKRTKKGFLDSIKNYMR